MGDFAKGIKNFKAGMKDDDDLAATPAKSGMKDDDDLGGGPGQDRGRCRADRPEGVALVAACGIAHRTSRGSDRRVKPR